MKGKDGRSYRAVSIDDEPVNLLIIEEMASEIELEVISFESPLKALEYIKSGDKEIDMVFVDYMMPEMNGFEFIRELKAFDELIPTIMVTAAVGTQEIKRKVMKAGISALLEKPIDIGYFWSTAKNIIELKERAEREYETIRILAWAAESKEPGIGSHTLRTAHYSRIIAAHLGMERAGQDIIFRAAELHDVGKIKIDERIIKKRGKLSEEEYRIMKGHSRAGYDILKNTESPYLKAGATIALTHHENYDGSGYPDGLMGEDIPLNGRIVALADTFDALTSNKPYRAAWEFERAVDYIKEMKGKRFFPEVVEAFLQGIDRIEAIYQEYRG